MKRGTPRHPKTKDLARRLRVPIAHAAGILEMLWQHVADFAPQGNVGKMSNVEIADATDWKEKEADRLIDGLIEAGWIDRHPEHLLIIHDWPEHCEDAVHSKLARATLFFADGTKPHFKRLGKDERVKVEESYAAHAEQIKAPPSAGKRTPSAADCTPSALESALPKPCLSPALPLPKPEPNAAEAAAPARVPRGYNLDEQYGEFRELFRETGAPLAEPEDFLDGKTGAWWPWTGLDVGKRMEVLESLRERIRFKVEPRFIPRPRNYLESGEWRRKPREAMTPAATGKSKAQQAIDEAMKL